MGGPVTVMQPRGDVDVYGRDAPGDGRPPPTLGEVWTASREAQGARNSDWQDIVYDDEFNPILTEINRRRKARGEAALLPPSWRKAPNNRQRSSYGAGDAYGLSQSGKVTREDAAKGILGEVERERKLDPKAFPGVNTDLDTFMAPRWAKEKAKREKAGDVLNRSQGAGSFTVSLLGGASKAFEDPINAMTLPIGGGGRTFATRLLTEVGANMGIEALQLPQAQRNLGMIDQKMTAGEAVTDVVSAGLGAGIFRTGLEGTGVAGKFVFDRAQRAMPMDWQLAQQLKREVPVQLRMPDQQAAIHVIERGAEIDASSPWRPTHQALDAHGERLQTTMDALQQGAPMPAAPAPLARPAAAKPAAAKPAARRGGSGLNGDAALRFIINDLEGGAKLNTDSGGLTKYGISTKSNPGIDIANLTEGQAMEIYRRKYIAPLKLQGLSGEAQLVAIDAKINHRGGFAEQLIREAGDDPARMIAMRRAEYARLIRQEPAKYGKYARGWENRLQKLEAKIGLRPGGSGEGVPAGAAPDPVEWPVRPAAMDAERPLVDVPDLELDPEVLNPALVGAARTLASERGGRSLNDIGGIASELGVDEGALRGAFESLVGRGELRQLRDGSFRRVASAGNAGPEDMVRYLARRGGLSYDGFSAAQRQRNLNMDNPPRGHDLKNSGNIDAFVPGAGPLLRPNGLGLDEAGELLWEAGYFGPVETTPRPSETELITLLDDVLRRGEKRYSFADQAPDARAAKDSPDKAGWQSEAHYEAVREQWRQSALRTIGRDLDEAEFAQLVKLEQDNPLDPAFMREVDGAGYDAGEALDPYVARMVNREIDDALEDAFLEIEDPLYDFDYDSAAAATGQAGRPGQGGQGSAVDGGNARAGGEGAGSGQGAADQALSPAALDAAEAAGALGPPQFDAQAHKAFDEPDGPAIRAVADSAWHDVRQMQQQIEGDGPFGPVFDDVDPRDWASVVQRLSQHKTGEVPGALFHPELGAIDVVWGKAGTGQHDGYGLAKIVQFHPEVLDDLPRLIEGMAVVERSKNRVNLQSADHRAGVRLDWDGKAKTWLITAFEMDKKAPPVAEVTRATGSAQAGNFPALEAAPNLGEMRAQGKPDAQMFDLGDGKGLRPIAEIEAELASDDAAIAAIQSCLK